MAKDFQATRFETVAVIAARVEQLAAGDMPHPDVHAKPHMDFQTIATMEFERGLLKFVSRRAFPPGADGSVRIVDKLITPPKR